MTLQLRLIAIAVAETIRTLGTVPSGALYACVMAQLSLHDYQTILASLKEAQLITEANHVLTWWGPQVCTCGAEKRRRELAALRVEGPYPPCTDTCAAQRKIG